MENYFVLLGLNNEANENEIDGAIRKLPEEFADTKIRQTLADRNKRAEMWAQLKNNETFQVYYNKKEIRIKFISKLPEEYGEFTVYCGSGSLMPGQYSAEFLENKQITETGEYGDGKIAVSPAPDVRFYYPAMKRDGLIYLIGVERNRAFVYDIHKLYSYNYVAVTFKWGAFSEKFYVTAPKGKLSNFPPSVDDTLHEIKAPSDGAIQKPVKIVGMFSDENKKNEVRFYERNSNGDYFEVEENRYE